LATVDPEQRQFRYRVTLIGADGSVARGAPVETTDDIVSVGAPHP
jgi:hypothetical protein